MRNVFPNRKGVFLFHGGEFYRICNDPKGSDKSKKQGAVRPNEAAACVFRIGGAGRSAAFLFEQKQHGLLHPEGGKFAFEWDWLPASGLSAKDFIAPSSFEFGETRRFRMGEMYGAVSFLQILAPEIQDRILTDFMDVEGNLLVTMHVHGINQNEAIKMASAATFAPMERRVVKIEGMEGS